MSFDIVIGRSKRDIEKYGTVGSLFMGKQYVHMGTVTSLSNNVYLDVAQSHVVFVVGKRGSGKSYSMGVIAEGIATLPDEIQQNLSVIMLDTMGVYWTMKYPNHQDAAQLQEWKLEGKGLNIVLFTPAGFYQSYKEKGIPTDAPFAIKPSDVNPDDWCVTFGLDTNSREGILLSRTVQILREKGDYSITEMVDIVENDKRNDEHTRNVVVNHLLEADGWGIFSKQGTPLKDLAIAGKVSVLDMSPYATLPNGWLIKALVIGLVSKKLFTQRMIARKNEEFANIDAAMHYFSREKKEKLDQPLVWIIVDEAHEVLPKDGKTVATDSLVTILREGRQPGISLVLASQQPGKIHTDVVTQSDIVISHRLTAQVDVDALGQITQTYMKEGLQEKLFQLPKSTGGGVVFDDQNERIFEIKVRPRFTWHGGSAPTALVEGNAEGKKIETRKLVE